MSFLNYNTLKNKELDELRRYSNDFFPKGKETEILILRLLVHSLESSHEGHKSVHNKIVK